MVDSLAPQPTEQERDALLARIFASRHFVHATSLRRILECICARTCTPGSSAPKEYEIAVDARIRPESFNPKVDPIVRVSVSGIRDRLAAYFGAEGSLEPFQLQITKGEYRAQFVQQEGVSTEASALRAFWSDYLAPQRPNLMLFAETLFFRDQRGNYVRNIYANDVDEGPSSISSHLWPGLDLSGFTPSYNFVPAGEVQCLLSLKAAFDAIKVPMEPRNARFVRWSDLIDCNLVLIGSSRTNPFIAHLAADEPLRLEDKQIVDALAVADEPRSYQGHRYVDGTLDCGTEVALVTRRPSPMGAGTITIVSANHGRGIEGAGDFFTRADQVAGLIERMNASEGALPRHFQVLLKIAMVDFDEEVVGVEYLKHRVVAAK